MPKQTFLILSRILSRDITAKENKRIHHVLVRSGMRHGVFVYSNVYKYIFLGIHGGSGGRCFDDDP